MKRHVRIVTALVLGVLLAVPGGSLAFQEEGTLRIGGMWALSGGAAFFGKASLGLATLAVDEINEAGGVKIGGKAVKLTIHPQDDACNAEQGLAAVRRLATVDNVLFSLGPTCSSVAEPVFGTLQKKLGDAGDTGLQLLFFTDTATKFGLAKLSPWVFRNTPDEPAMYDFIVKYLKDKHPDLKRVMVSYESDFAHSAATWKAALEPALKKYGHHEVVEVVDWRWLDTEMGAQVTKLRRANADVYFSLTHTTSTCASMKELKRQRIKPKMIFGITSLAGTEVLLQCPDVADGIISPSNFAPITARAKQIADKAWDKYKADSNIHSVPAYENVHLVKGLIEKAGLKNTEASLLEDRRKVRDLLAKVGTFEGVIGRITIRPEDDKVKPRDVDKDMLLVQVKSAKWVVFWAPPHLKQN
ncbi:MAG: ABC transporter substrate-binding protein [Candidatus Rokuibacteriota bacterium]